MSFNAQHDLLDAVQAQNISKVRQALKEVVGIRDITILDACIHALDRVGNSPDYNTKRIRQCDIFALLLQKHTISRLLFPIMLNDIAGIHRQDLFNLAYEHAKIMGNLMAPLDPYQLERWNAMCQEAERALTKKALKDALGSTALDRAVGVVKKM